MKQLPKPPRDLPTSEWLGGETLIGELPRQRWTDVLRSLKIRITAPGAAPIFVSGLLLGLISSLFIIFPRKHYHRS